MTFLPFLALLLGAGAEAATSQTAKVRYSPEPARLFMVAMELPRFKGTLSVNGIAFLELDMSVFEHSEPPFRAFSPPSISTVLMPGRNEIRLEGTVEAAPARKQTQPITVSLHGFSEDGMIADETNRMFQQTLKPKGAKVDLRITFELDAKKIRLMPWWSKAEKVSPLGDEHRREIAARLEQVETTLKTRDEKAYDELFSWFHEQIIASTGAEPTPYTEAQRELKTQIFAQLDLAKSTFPSKDALDLTLVGDRLVLPRTKGQPYLFKTPLAKEPATEVGSIYFLAKVDGQWKVIQGPRSPVQK